MASKLIALFDEKATALSLLTLISCSGAEAPPTSVIKDSATRSTQSGPAVVTPSAAPKGEQVLSAPTAAEEAEDPKTHQRILELLKKYGATFGTLEHQPTKTSQESADVRGVPLASGSKAMLLKSKGEFFLAVLSAAKALDLPAIRKLLGISKLSLASLDDVKKITGCLNGAVPPFGSLFGIKTYLDRSVIEQGPEINFNAGLRTFSVLHLSVADYLRIEGDNAVIENFSMPAAAPTPVAGSN
jgi:Ala-tRNA(Pro) deacylase